MLLLCDLFLFKQKTAYELRISDWSSDVCSYDLNAEILCDLPTLECETTIMSKRKQRIDSATAAVKVMQGATREIAPPAHVRMSEEDWQFWHSVIAEFARSEWTDHQLEMAAMLARAMADLEREQYELRAEGDRKSTRLNSSHECASRMLSST